MQVAGLHDVLVDDGEVSNACRSEIERDGGTEPACANQQDAGAAKPQLAGLTDVRKDQLAVIPLQLFRRE